MAYEASFGTLSGDVPPPAPGGPFRIALFGDFTGRSNRGERGGKDEIVERTPREVSADKLDELLARLEPKLVLPFGRDGGKIELGFEELDQFHPERLLKEADLVMDLVDLKGRVGRAEDQIKEWGGQYGAWGPLRPATRPAYGRTIAPVQSFSDFTQWQTFPTAENAGGGRLPEMLAQAVGGRAAGLDDPSEETLEEVVHQAVGDAIREIIHHPDYQALEAAWRGVDFLARRTFKGEKIKIVLFDVTAEELAVDLASADDVSQSAIYDLLVNKTWQGVNGDPWAMVVGLYNFDLTPPHAELLGRLGKLGAVLQAPFLASLNTRVLGEEFQLEGDEKAVWNELRALPEAGWLGLATPGFLLRPPFGDGYKPVEDYTWEEFSPEEGPSGLLWGDPALAAACLLAQDYMRAGWTFKPGAKSEIPSAPIFVHRTDDDEKTYTVEHTFTSKIGQQVVKLGGMPLLGVRGRDAIEVGKVVSLAIEPPDLLGRWERPAASDVASAASRGEKSPLPKAASRSSGDDDMDDGLAALMGGDDSSSDDESSDSSSGDSDDFGSSDDDDSPSFSDDDDSSSSTDDDDLSASSDDDSSSDDDVTSSDDDDITSSDDDDITSSDDDDITSSDDDDVTSSSDDDISTDSTSDDVSASDDDELSSSDDDSSSDSDSGDLDSDDDDSLSSDSSSGDSDDFGSSDDDDDSNSDDEDSSSSDDDDPYANLDDDSDEPTREPDPEPVARAPEPDPVSASGRKPTKDPYGDRAKEKPAPAPASSGGFDLDAYMSQGESVSQSDFSTASTVDFENYFGPKVEKVVEAKEYAEEEDMDDGLAALMATHDSGSDDDDSSDSSSDDFGSSDDDDSSSDSSSDDFGSSDDDDSSNSLDDDLDSSSDGSSLSSSSDDDSTSSLDDDLDSSSDASSLSSSLDDADSNSTLDDDLDASSDASSLDSASDDDASSDDDAVSDDDAASDDSSDDDVSADSDDDASSDSDDDITSDSDDDNSSDSDDVTSESDDDISAEDDSPETSSDDISADAEEESGAESDSSSDDSAPVEEDDPYANLDDDSDEPTRDPDPEPEETPAAAEADEPPSDELFGDDDTSDDEGDADMSTAEDTDLDPEGAALLEKLESGDYQPFASGSPTILNFRELVQPVSEDEPAGASRVMFSLKEKFDENRKEVNPDNWDPDDPLRPSEPKFADWNATVSLAQESLTSSCKHLQIGAYLIEAMTKLHGFAGMRDGLHLMRLLVTVCWNRVLPEIEDPDEDLERRAGPFNWFDEPTRSALFPNTVRQIPVLHLGEQGFGWQQWKDSQEGKRGMKPELIEQAMLATPRDRIQQVFDDATACLTEMQELGKFLDRKMGSVAPGMTMIRQAVSECRQFVQQSLQRKGPAGDEGGVEPGGGAMVAANAGEYVAGTVMMAGGSAAVEMVRRPVTRDDIYRQLKNVAQQLSQMEPHSPVPYLIERCVALGAMPFPMLMKALIRDMNVLTEMNRELGIKEEEPPAENNSGW